LPDGTSRIFFSRGLDDPNHVDESREISFYAQGILRLKGLAGSAACSKTRTDLPDGQIISFPLSSCITDSIRASLLSVEWPIADITHMRAFRQQNRQSIWINAVPLPAAG
jgi:hypothetical protein